MLYYGRIGVSKGIDLTKSNRSKECMICHYWLFNHGLRFQDYVCNGCHDLIMLILAILLLSLLKMLIIVFLFITLANPKQLIYGKILFLKIVGI